jgi:putative ABC transport system permease protein
MLQDLRHGFLLLRSDAGVSILIVVVLALGIGGNAAIFTLLKAAFLDPLPYPDADRLVTIHEVTGWNPSVSEFLEIRRRNQTFERLAFAEHRDMQLSGHGEPARVYAARVTASFLPLLGAKARQGRIFAEEDNEPRRTPTVVLTDGFWRSRMGGDPHVVGRALRLDGAPAQILGVLEPGFHFDYPTLRVTDPVDIYVAYPLEWTGAIDVSSNGRGVPVRVLARMREGVTLAAAQSEVRNIARMLTREHPSAFPNPQHDPSLFTFVALPLRDAIVGTQRSLLWLLLGGVAVLLLIASANTAQILLARSVRRQREIAIRAALGASRLRLIRQFLLEGLVLGFCGGLAGLIASGWLARGLAAMFPARSPLLASAHSDLRVIGFTLAISLVSAAAFGAIPALKGSRWTSGPVLGSRGATREGNRWRHAMIATEATLSVFLLCAAGLVTENLWTLISAPMGFDPDHVLTIKLKLPSPVALDSIDPKAGLAFQQYLDRIAAIPGVESAATVTGPPLRPARIGNTELEDVRDPNGELKVVWSDIHQVSANYFRTLKIPLLAGRTFRDTDIGPHVKVAIVNEEFARRFGLGADIVGKRVPDPDGSITIVGMVGNVRAHGLNTASYPEVYLSSLQLNWVNVYLVVRSAIPSGQLVKQVKAAIASANADQAVYRVMTMREMIADSMAGPTSEVFLIGAFALIAAIMAAAGMYSVIACLVSQRTSEIAIRIALGAGRIDIVRTVLGSTVAWVLAGLAVGLGLGIATRHIIRTLSNTASEGSIWMYAGRAVLLCCNLRGRL